MNTPTIPIMLGIDVSPVTALIDQTPVAAMTLMTGAVGISIAFYLVFVTTKTVPWRYPAAFFALGSIIVLANTHPIAPPYIARGLRLSVLAILVFAQLYAGRWVVVHRGLETPTEALVETARELRTR